MKDNQGNEYEIDHIDHKELIREKERKIIESDKFLKFSVVIGDDDYDDAISLESKNSKPYMMSVLFAVIRDTLIKLIKEYTVEWEAAKLTDTDMFMVRQDIKDEDEEEE